LKQQHSQLPKEKEKLHKDKPQKEENSKKISTNGKPRTGAQIRIRSKARRKASKTVSWVDLSWSC
jgi:hypothetical protein